MSETTVKLTEKFCTTQWRIQGGAPFKPKFVCIFQQRFCKIMGWRTPSGVGAPSPEKSWTGHCNYWIAWQRDVIWVYCILKTIEKGIHQENQILFLFKLNYPPPSRYRLLQRYMETILTDTSTTSDTSLIGLGLTLTAHTATNKHIIVFMFIILVSLENL